MPDDSSQSSGPSPADELVSAQRMIEISLREGLALVIHAQELLAQARQHFVDALTRNRCRTS